MVKVHAIGERGNKDLYDVAYIRLLNPLGVLAQKKRITLTQDKTYKNYEESDIFFVQRMWAEEITQNEVMQFIRFTKESKKKLVYEIDDNLLDLPSINSRHKNIIYALSKNADCMIVTTKNLKERMSKFCDNIIIIPNHLSLNQIGERRDGLENVNAKLKIGYMGTFSHQNDFQMIKLPLMQLLNKYKNSLELEILGALPDVSTLRNISNVTILSLENRTQYNMFWSYMCKNIYWDIGLAPLKRDEFTVCKSDIKFYDYAALGIAGVFSNHPAYESIVDNEINGILSDNTPEAWFYSMEKLVLDKGLIKKIAKNAHEKLYRERILEEHCDLWLNVILSLTTESRRICD